MPLAPGVPLTDATPTESRPRDGRMRMVDVPVAFVGTKAKGRKAVDGSHWCRCCDTTISTNSNAAFCAQHQTERNSQIQRLREAHQVSQVPVPVETIDSLLRIKAQLMEAIGEASAEFNRMDPPPHGSWVDKLMRASKELALSADRLREFVKAAEEQRPLQPTPVVNFGPLS